MTDTAKKKAGWIYKHVTDGVEPRKWTLTIESTGERITQFAAPKVDYRWVLNCLNKYRVKYEDRTDVVVEVRRLLDENGYELK
jgi:hypothetical protein